MVYLDALAPPDRPALVWQAIEPVLGRWQQAAGGGVPVVPLRQLASERAGQEDAAIHFADVGAAAESH